MSVRSITASGDWTFGKGRAHYIKGSKEINQNVVTRLRSFKNDWFLDVDAGIDWINLLGSRGNERRILRVIENTVLQTPGVIKINALDVLSRDADRTVKISLSYTDVFNNTVSNVVDI